MTEAVALRVVGLLRAARVEGVVVSGGEPTLLPYLGTLLAELARPFGAGQAGPRVVLSTNGLAPPRAMEQILPHLSWIALPLESADPEEHRRMRTGVAPHRERVLALLRGIRAGHPGVGVKLGTVITRLNLAGARRTLDLITDDRALPDVWKVYQMSETNYGADNADWLSVEDDVFEEVVRGCEKTAADRGVRLQVYRNSTRGGTYVFIDPDCQVVVVDDAGERRIGGLFEDGDQIGEQLSHLVVGGRNTHNFTTTYPEI